MKKCGSCGKEKDPSLFYKRAISKDGLASMCKECQREYDKRRLHAPHRVKARDDYSKTEKGRIASSAAKKRWELRNTVKRAAHIIVGNAIRDGSLKKNNKCDECGSEKNIQAHHDDYRKPLDVRWLCSMCHAEWHKNNDPLQ